MHLRFLELEEFRLFRHLRLDLPPSGIALFGSNASGKSSLVEAIAFLATTRSIRGAPDRELINWSSGSELGFPPFARAVGQVAWSQGQAAIEIALQADPTGATPLQKSIRLNGRSVRAMDIVGTLKVVLFSPEDVALITGPPATRRRYLDVMVSQIDTRYLRALARYNRILEQRNSLLKSLSRAGMSPFSPAVATQLAFWDDELVSFGSTLIARRLVAIRELSTFARQRFSHFAGDLALEVAYQPSVAEEVTAGASNKTVDLLVPAIAQRFGEQLANHRADEIRRGMSLLGPHRDDVRLTLNGRELAAFGSRGQQRLAVVALKLAETDLMASQSGERPVVLLDDVLSELDVQRRHELLVAVSQLKTQVVLTATDHDLLPLEAVDFLPRYEIDAGQVRSIMPDDV
ncbi:MAG: DNA replication and repair protein RecF [Chloroflexota bacterium]